MPEAQVVERSHVPVVQEQLEASFRSLGVERGMAVMVHTSLSKIGWVCGGAVAVIQALMRVVSSEGTLVMATPSSGCTDPRYWQNPPVPPAWWPTIRAHMPAFLPEATPSLGVGVVPETFRSMPGVYRSNHPACSFAAWGAGAKNMVASHDLDHPFGEGSPLRKLYEADGFVLLLGVDHDVNTSLHLAQERAKTFETRPQGGPMRVGGKRCWVEYVELCAGTEGFVELGRAFEKQAGIQTAAVGQASAVLLPQAPLVDFATDWFRREVG